MNHEHELQERGVATADFERDLEALVLSAFAGGAAVEGVRYVRSKPGSVPDWRIEITKQSPDGESNAADDD